MYNVHTPSYTWIISTQISENLKQNLPDSFLEFFCGGAALSLNCRRLVRRCSVKWQSTDGANTLYQTFAINNTIHHTLLTTSSYQMITILCSWAMGAYTLPYFNIPFHTMPYQTDPHSTKPYQTLTHFNTTFVPFITFTKLPHCTTNHTISCHTIQ